ncbi:MAG: hypothetical protein J6K62_03420 [Clostridia bacterium]|nr:hypothetical protein [Clostridia bacterium]
MKRWLALLLVLVMCVAMTACSKKSNDKKDDDEKPGTSDGDGAGSAVGGGAVDAVVGVYDALVGTLSGDNSFSSRAELSVHLSDEAITMLEQAIFKGDSGMDWKWLNNITVGVDAAQKDDLMSMAMDLALSNTKVVSLELLMDMANGKLFMGIPELSDKYIGGALNLPAADAQPAWMTMFTEYGSEFLPDGETLGKLLDKYLDIALKSIVMPAKESVELTVSGVTKTVSQQKIVINQKMIAAVCTAVLNEAKSDADIKAILQNVQKVAEEEFGATGVDLHAEFVAMIDEVLAEIASDSELSEAEMGTVTVYTDGDELVGLTVSFGGAGYFECLTLTQDGKAGLQISYGEMVALFSIAGTSTENNGKVSGTYEICVDANPMVTVELKDVVENGTNASGTIRIWPEDGIYAMLGGQMSAIATMDPGLEFVFNGTANSAELTINILMDTKVFAGVTIKTSTGTAANITLPSSDKVVDQSNIQSWVSSMDLSKIVDNLRKGGLPTQLVDALEMALEYMEQPSMGFGDAGDYYGGFVGSEDVYDSDTLAWNSAA